MSRGDGGSAIKASVRHTTCRFCPRKGKPIRYFPRSPTPRGTGGCGTRAAEPIATGRDRSRGRRCSTNENSRPRGVESRQSQHAPPEGCGRPNNDASRNVLFLGVAFSPPPGPLNARCEDSASDARHVAGVAEVTDVPGFETSGRRAPCNALLTGQGRLVKESRANQPW